MPFDALPIEDGATEASVALLRHVEQVLSRPSRWAKGHLRSGPWWWRSYCAIGALAYAAGKYGFRYSETDIVRAELDLAANRHGFSTIVALNDCDSTTHSFLILVVRDALYHMESQHAFVSR